ncbi:hypothetical protein [Pseudaestuariivita atlantica]|uniref:Uncharacterized protein n=1 Tax=Pseudaestuariivita atlantica TaxID=1317121 RepID=A0A0L1JL75_9RHOB|nr:hypothetical protein [Pseudaestuariivita atlantica]KNG92501.1 hypothetical protein ATO11_17315 [Pseudaestuariivita atlantica]
MGITLSFLIKHVRPLGEDGYTAYCTQDLIQQLGNLGFNANEIADILAQWRQTALSDPEGQSDRFVAAAQAVSEARWGELYNTDQSTIMFLTWAELQSLSAAAAQAGANANVNWNSGGEIGICVTITRNSNAHHIRWNATGCTGNTDGNGNMNHFTGLTP